jgi:hypothetical protein
MNPGPSDCPRCALYKGEVALLQGELNSLRQSVLALTRPASKEPALEIVGKGESVRFVITETFQDGPDFCCRVSLTYREQVSAQCVIPLEVPAALPHFFRDLAVHKSGWEGEKSFSTNEGQLAISCTYEGKLFRPEISMEVTCALDNPTFDPRWTIHLRLDIDPESLVDIASSAQALFAMGSST